MNRRPSDFVFAWLIAPHGETVGRALTFGERKALEGEATLEHSRLRPPGEILLRWRGSLVRVTRAVE
jgi:hypothetical protein